MHPFFAAPHRILRALWHLLLLNTGLRSHGSFILPLSLSGGRWTFRRKDGKTWTRLGLRPGTSDFPTFFKVFLQEGYRLSHLAQWKGIQAEYDRLVVAKKVPLILDCGANIGLSALYFRTLFPEAALVAVEPETGNFELAGRNLQDERVLLLKGAVADRDGWVRIQDPKLGTDAFRVRKASQRSPGAIKAYSIPRLLQIGRKFGPTVPFLIKIDIEGFERELFASNTGWVASFKVLAIELHDRCFPGTANSSNFLKVIAKADRDLVQLGENMLSIRNDEGA